MVFAALGGVIHQPCASTSKIAIKLSAKMSCRFCCCLAIFSISGCIAFLSDDVQVHPHLQLAQPGDNISFLCNTSLNISKFHWTINNKNADPSLVEIIDGHTMKLHLYNVGIGTKLQQSSDVVCETSDNIYMSGSTVYTGYPPLPPKIECLMQNMDSLHCRWSDQFDARTKRHPEWIPETRYKANYKDMVHEETTGNYTGRKASCTWKEPDWFDINYWSITVDVENKFGESSNIVSFHPHEHVILSPPKLTIKNFTNQDEGVGAVLHVVANTSLTAFKNLRQSCRFKIQVEYEEIPTTVNIAHLQETIDSYNHNEKMNFWDKWKKFSDANIAFQTDWNKHSIAKINSSNEVYLTGLPANIPVLLQVQWILNGNKDSYQTLFNCGGLWSQRRVAISWTSILPPPSVTNVAVLYFNEKRFSPVSNSLTIFLWQLNTSFESHHQHNPFSYSVSFRKCRQLDSISVSKSSKYLMLPSAVSSNKCDLQVSSVSGNQSSSSRWLRFAASTVKCTPQVFSVSIEKLTSDSVVLKVIWALVPEMSNKICQNKASQEGLKIILFFWRENSSFPFEKHRLNRASKRHVRTTFVNISRDVKGRIQENVKQTSPVQFQVSTIRNGSASFQYPFHSHSAYRISAALSLPDGDDIYQGPALPLSPLLYYNITKPSGRPTDISCSEETETSLKVSWSTLNPTERNGPIDGYRIYYTTNRKCFNSGHQENCHDNNETMKVWTEDVQVKDERNQNRTNLAGWCEELDEQSEFSSILKNLKPGTTYHIGITAYNAAGESEFLHTISGRTQKSIFYWTLGIPFIILLLIFIMLICLLYRMRHRIKSCCALPLPDPAPHVTVFQDTSCEKFEPVSISLIRLDDYSLQHPVNIVEETIQLKNNPEKHRKIIELENCNGSLHSPKQVKKFSPPDLKPRSNLIHLNNNSLANGLLHAQHCRVDENSGDHSSIGLYLRNAIGRLYSEESENEILPLNDSDVPCCSSQSSSYRSSLNHDDSESDTSSEENHSVYTSNEVAMFMGERLNMLQHVE